MPLARPQALANAWSGHGRKVSQVGVECPEPILYPLPSRTFPGGLAMYPNNAPVLPGSNISPGGPQLKKIM